MPHHIRARRCHRLSDMFLVFPVGCCLVAPLLVIAWLSGGTLAMDFIASARQPSFQQIAVSSRSSGLALPRQHQSIISEECGGKFQSSLAKNSLLSSGLQSYMR